MKHDADFLEPINRDRAVREAPRRGFDVQDDANPKELKRTDREGAIAHHPGHDGNASDGKHERVY